jgi:hypothetical protein
MPTRRRFLATLLGIPAAALAIKLPISRATGSPQPTAPLPEPQRICVPMLPLYSNPVISLEEIRTRRFGPRQASDFVPGGKTLKACMEHYKRAILDEYWHIETRRENS